MKKVLIFYPEQFKSYSKFHRKVSRIIQSSEGITFMYLSDPNGFISEFSSREKIKGLREISSWQSSQFTHAIIFDDGEEFSEEVSVIKELKTPLRLINIPITRVVNIKKDICYKALKSTDNYEYIGRRSYWGNPYSMLENGESREEVIRKYEYDFKFDKFPNKDKSKVYELSGKRLGCFCKPEKCHGDVLADFLNSWDDGE
jgi:hypothetical protein